MSSNFDIEINRYGSNCAKWDEADEIYGKDLIHLAVADMDFKSPEAILDAMRKVVEHGVFGYTVFNENYFDSVINWMKNKHSWEIKREWMLFSPRVGIGVSASICALTEEGDGIIIQEPLYGTLRNCVEKNNRKLIISNLKLENGRYEMDFEDLESKIDENVKLMIICNPHNPVGRVWTKEELKKLESICLKHGIIVLSDEIHADIIYGDNKHIPIASLSEEMANMSIVYNAPTKTFNIPGVIVSNMFIPNPEIRQKVARVMDAWGMHNPNVFSVPVVEAAYTECDDWLEEALKYIRDNYDFTRNFIKTKMPELDIIESEGTYLMWIDCRKFIPDENKLKKFFLEDAKVGIYVGSVFGEAGKGFIRINLASPRAVIERALERIYKAYLQVK